MLARSLIELINKTPLDYRATRVMLPSDQGEPYYIFLLLPWIPGKSYTEYRDVRRSLLEWCCMIVKLNFPEAKDIIGIATETGKNTARSEDVIYLDARDWTEQQQVEAQSVQKEFGILTQTEMFAATEYEYPSQNSESGRGPIQTFKKRDGRMRNKPCPCHSGKKFKHCHGRVE